MVNMFRLNSYWNYLAQLSRMINMDSWVLWRNIISKVIVK